MRKTGTSTDCNTGHDLKATNNTFSQTCVSPQPVRFPIEKSPPKPRSYSKNQTCELLLIAAWGSCLYMRKQTLTASDRSSRTRVKRAPQSPPL